MFAYAVVWLGLVGRAALLRPPAAVPEHRDRPRRAGAGDRRATCSVSVGLTGLVGGRATTSPTRIEPYPVGAVVERISLVALILACGPAALRQLRGRCATRRRGRSSSAPASPSCFARHRAGPWRGRGGVAAVLPLADRGGGGAGSAGRSGAGRTVAARGRRRRHRRGRSRRCWRRRGERPVTLPECGTRLVTRPTASSTSSSRSSLHASSTPSGSRIARSGLSAVHRAGIVGHQHDRAGIAGDRVEHLLPADRVEVVRRLVEQQHVRARADQRGEREPGLLPAGQHAGRLVDVVAGEQERAEDPAQVGVGLIRRGRAHVLEDRPVRRRASRAPARSSRCADRDRARPRRCRSRAGRRASAAGSSCRRR